MNTIYLSLLLALIGGIISFIKDWKLKKEEGFLKSNWITILALILLLIGSFQAFFTSRKAIIEQKLADSTSLAKDSINEIYKDSLLSFQNKIIRLQEREVDTGHYIIDLNKMLVSSQQNEIKLQDKIKNEITGGNSIPIVEAKVKFYPYDHEARWNGAQVEEWIDKYIIQFNLINVGNYPLYNIRSTKTSQGISIYPYTLELPKVNVLSSKESTLLFPTIVGDDSNPDDITLSHKITIQWKNFSYNYFVQIDKDQVYDSVEEKYKWIYFKRSDYYEYEKKNYKTAEEFEKAFRTNVAND